MPDCIDPATGTIPDATWTAGFNEDFQKYWKQIYELCRLRLRNHHDAEDAASQAFLQVYKARGNYNPLKATGGLGGYLTTTALNICKRMRGGQRRAFLAIKSDDHAVAFINEPFIFELEVKPHRAVCALVNKPSWLSMVQQPAKRSESKQRKKEQADGGFVLPARGKTVPTTKQRMEGTPSSAGQWDFTVLAEYEGAKAEQPFILSVVRRRGLLASKVPPPWPSFPGANVRNVYAPFDEELGQKSHSETSPELQEDAERLLSALPDHWREIIKMEYEGLSREEIAEETGETRVNIRQIICRARDIMRCLRDKDRPQVGGNGPSR